MILKATRDPYFGGNPPMAKIPDKMRAAAIDRFGPPDVLTLHQLPVPVPETGEVLIEMHSAGVGIWDAKIREGTWAEGDTRFPRVLGTDGAGVVVAKGTGVRDVHVGDRVWAYEYDNPRGGFYAEYVAVDAGRVGRIPTFMALLEAGAAAVTGLTALQGIEDHLRVEPGDTVLVFGATGAVGTLAVQFARGRGARVIGTASGSVARELVLDLGASETFDALESLAPKGFDAVLALTGGEALERCLELLHLDGRLAYPNGVEPEPRGPERKFRRVSYDAAAGPLEWERLAIAAEDAGLRVVIADVYPLTEAAEAHRRLERGHVLGRVVLQIRENGHA
jgi:NADPH2:quinone reductase